MANLVSESALVRALDQNSIATWCFIAINSGSICYWTKQFIDLWNIQPAESERKKNSGSVWSGDISTSSSTVKNSLIAMGIPANWFTKSSRDLQNGSSTLKGEELTRRDGLRICPAFQAILDDKGLPLGTLITFEILNRPTLSTDQVLRSLRASRLVDSLSPRESEVLTLIFEGMTNKAIALRSKISEKTVEKHRARIMKKLKAGSSAEMIRVTCDAFLINDLQPLSQDATITDESSQEKLSEVTAQQTSSDIKAG